jgi:pilus assembly protein CpaB
MERNLKGPRMPTINRNLVYLVVAVLLGVVASMMAVHYVNKQVAARTQTGTKETREVVVPVRDLEQGATLTSDDVAVRDVPATFVPADAITPDDYDAYMGQVLRAPLAHGAPIPSAAVETVAEHFSSIIEPGNVAYSIQVDETTSVSGLLVPGDHIDLLLLTDDNENDRIRPLLGNVLVLATGQLAKGVRASGEDNPGSYSNITLELSPDDAQRVGMAMKIGELRVLLRKPGNKEPFDLKTLSKADLLRVGKPRQGSGIQFIIGGKA